jgi:hypothetical protein
MAARVTHLMGWTVVRVTDVADLGALDDHLVAGGQVVLELSRDLGDAHDAALVGLRPAYESAGTDLRVVVADGEARERLRAAGVRDVHESLDAAVGDVAPAQHVEPQISHNLPFAGDTVVVTAKDMLGPEHR